MSMSKQEAEQYLLDNGVCMGATADCYYVDWIVKRYVESYKDWKIGDKVKIKFDKNKLEDEIVKEYGENQLEELLEEHLKLFLKDEWEIESFYNCGAMQLVGFDMGVGMDWFEKVV